MIFQAVVPSLVALLLSLARSSDAFVVSVPSSLPCWRQHGLTTSYQVAVTTTRPLSLLAATTSGGGGGFGSGNKSSAASAAASSSSSPSLKPKQQWDRYLAMSKSKDGESIATVRVAVRKESAEDGWLEVGAVRSADGVNVEVAVARQRSLIADHARRLYPLQISKQDKVEWGYSKQTEASNDDEDQSEARATSWSIINVKDMAAMIEAGLEKKIGFEGQPDPASGYYCLYNGGRRVTGDAGAAEGKGAKPESKKRTR